MQISLRKHAQNMLSVNVKTSFGSVYALCNLLLVGMHVLQRRQSPSMERELWNSKLHKQNDTIFSGQFRKYQAPQPFILIPDSTKII